MTNTERNIQNGHAKSLTALKLLDLTRQPKESLVSFSSETSALVTQPASQPGDFLSFSISFFPSFFLPIILPKIIYKPLLRDSEEGEISSSEMF